LTLRSIFCLLIAGTLLTACGSYRQNILFQVEAANASRPIAENPGNYTIQKNDLLTLEVFTNHGEKIVDPNRESFKDANVATMGSTSIRYVVKADGTADFPLIEPIAIEGLTLEQAEEALEEAYEKFYEGAYIVLKFENKRVIVLGAPGGQVIPLEHENMRLTEVLALAKGVTQDGRGHNIRVIRQDQVMIADLSTFEGYQKSNLVMQPGDIIYVEPVRRPFIEGLRDYSPLITIATSIATLIFIISQSNP
jgi:polysaccharide biosynthesis/export protein